MAIDYERAKRENPKLQAALTRAQRKPEAQRYAAVLEACKLAVKAWDQWGCWPDNWTRWQRSLVDAANAHTRATGIFVNAPRLEDLQ